MARRALKSEIRVAPRADITDHVEVVVVDVEHFLHVLVYERVRHGPADPFHLLEVDGALVVGVVHLHWAHQRQMPRRIRSVRRLTFRGPTML